MLRTTIFANCDIGPFGGNLSVRMPEGRKPIIIFGQDESIFNQFSSRGRQWTGPTGQCAIMLKSSGEGLMISAFQSCEVCCCFLIDSHLLCFVGVSPLTNRLFIG
jgi:hypothetical protein